MRSLPASFAGGVASRLGPSIARLALVYVVARDGVEGDVGRLGVAATAAYLCGSLAEMGMMTSLSLPRKYFGVDAPPLRATRAARWAAAAAGSGAYGLLWLAGLGSHEPVFLLGLPLPFLLALSYGYTGAMNFGGALKAEGLITAGEGVVLLGAAFAIDRTTSALVAALVALSVSRAVGTVARVVVLRNLPRHEAARVPGVARQQLWFLGSTGAIALHGHLDVLVLGFFSGTYVLLDVYYPLLRTCYTAFLVAEGLSLAMYATDDTTARSRLVRHWRVTGIALGLLGGAVVLAAADPLIDVLLDRRVEGLAAAVALFAILIPVRFGSYVVSVDLVRAGRQAARIPVLVVGMLFLLAGAIVGWRTDSVTWLAGFRLASEAAVTLGFLYVARAWIGRARAAPA